MNIMKTAKIPITACILGLILSSSAYANQNSVSLTQSGAALANLSQDGVSLNVIVDQRGAGNFLQTSQLDENNEINVFQDGVDNQAVISQQGRDNFVQLSQEGSANAANLAQSGAHNVLFALQEGLGNFVEVKMAGNGNEANISYIGDGNVGSHSLSGNDHLLELAVVGNGNNIRTEQGVISANNTIVNRMITGDNQDIFIRR